jgi:hypothetical protein
MPTDPGEFHHIEYFRKPRQGLASRIMKMKIFDIGSRFSLAKQCIQTGCRNVEDS